MQPRTIALLDDTETQAQRRDDAPYGIRTSRHQRRAMNTRGALRRLAQAAKARAAVDDALAVVRRLKRELGVE